MYVVTQRKYEDSPVYELKPENGNGRTRVIHRNLLLPCDFLPVEKVDTPAEPRKQRKKVSKRRQTEQEHSSGDEADWRAIIIPQARNCKQVKSHLRPDPPEFQPHPEAAAAEDLDSEDRTEQQLPEEEELGTPDDTELLNAQSEDESPASAQSDQEDTHQSPVTQKKYPSRIRKPRMMFTYHRLGQPIMSQE